MPKARPNSPKEIGREIFRFTQKMRRPRGRVENGHRLTTLWALLSCFFLSISNELFKIVGIVSVCHAAFGGESFAALDLFEHMFLAILRPMFEDIRLQQVCAAQL